MDNFKAFNDFIQEIKENWLRHQMEAERFKALYETATNNDLLGLHTSNETNPVIDTSIKNEPKTLPSKMNGHSYSFVSIPRKETFEDKITQILNDKGRPMFAEELIEEFKLKTGKLFERKNFSSKLAIIAKNKKTLVNKEYKQFPNKFRFWWGLSEWFRDGDFESPFKDKVMIEAENMNELKSLL